MNKFKHKIAPEAAYDFMQAVGKKRLKRCSSKNDEQTLNNMYQLQNGMFLYWFKFNLIFIFTTIPVIFIATH